MRDFENAFQALNLLEEDVFSLDKAGMEELDIFLADDDALDIMETIDLDAETAADLESSYDGKVILACDVCKQTIYKDPTMITRSEDTELVNVGEVCPICGSDIGFMPVGQVDEFESSDMGDDIVDFADDDLDGMFDMSASDVEDSMEGDDSFEPVELTEDIEAANIVTSDKDIEVREEDGKVKIEIDDKEDIEEIIEEEPIAEVEQMIVPITNETEALIDAEESEGSEAEVIEEPFVDDIEEEDIEEIDEEGFDEVVESYLQNVYHNVAKYRTTGGTKSSSNIKLEGLITFDSGRQAATNFTFTPRAKEAGKCILEGYNEQIASNSTSYKLSCSLDKGKLIVESLKYRYFDKDNKKRIIGKKTAGVKKHK